MLAASLLTLHLLFAGLFFAIPVHRHIQQNGTINAFNLLCLAFPAGLLTNMLLMLIFRSIFLSCALGAAIDLAGLLVLYVYRNELRFDTIPIGMRAKEKTAARILCAVVAAYLIYQLLLQPIVGWDARSIWFFGGKIIFYSGGLFADSGWTDLFAHPEYPKLIAVLSAQTSWLAGYWNEYVPLTAIAILLCVEFLLLAYLTESFVVLSLFFILLYKVIGVSEYFINGYADMHLALLAVLASGLFTRAVARLNKFDLIVGTLVLGLAATLKNEGMVLAAIIGLPSGVAFYLRARRASRKQATSSPTTHTKYAGSPLTSLVQALRQHWAIALALCVAILPAILWQILIWQWGISSDLLEGGGGTARLVSRLDAASIGAILQAIDVGAMFALAICGAVLMLACTGRKHLIYCLPLAFCALYLGVLTMVYLSTPYDLAWHLGTSAQRVALPIKLTLIYSTAVYLALVLNKGGYRWRSKRLAAAARP